MVKNYLFQVIIAKQVELAELGVTLPLNLKKGQVTSHDIFFDSVKNVDLTLFLFISSGF